jgi:hypothetical protein
MTDPIAAKLLDELIVLFNHHRKDRGFHTVENALNYVRKTAQEHDNQPVTLSLAKIFDEEHGPDWRKSTVCSACGGRLGWYSPDNGQWVSCITCPEGKKKVEELGKQR